MFSNNLLMAAAGGGEAYTIDYSCRFDGSSSYLSRTPASAGNRKTWTYSTWGKILPGSDNWLFGAGDSASRDYGSMHVPQGNNMTMWMKENNYTKCQVSTSQKLKDPSAFYHLLVAIDTTQATDADRVSLYVNGIKITDFNTETYPALDFEGEINNTTYEMAVGRNGERTTGSFHGYLSDAVFIDGLALDHTYFGETDSTTGQWIPKDPSDLTFGTNGFWLDFADSSDLGNDVSGNDNDFTSNNLAAADQMTDSPTNNFCTMNPVNSYSGLTLSDGNLTATAGAQVYNKVNGTLWVPYQQGGQWYFEWTCGGDNDQQVGWTATDFSDLYPGQSGSISYAWARNGGAKYSPGAGGAASGQTYTSGDVLGWLLDFDAGEVKVGKVSSGSISYNITWTDLGTYEASGRGAWTATDRPYNGSGTFNFGANGFAISSAPGKALSTANFSAPTIKDGTAYFQTTLYTGDGSTQSVNQGGNKTFSPSFVWIKNRDAADDHCLFDTARGATKLLISNDSDAETTDADTLTAFDSDGFSLGDDDKVNTNTEKYVGWQWLESATSGFDIVTYTGNATNRTINHSLSAVPELMIVRRHDGVENWAVYHGSNTATPASEALVLDLDGATNPDVVTVWNDTAPTSSVFTVGTGGMTNSSGGNYIAYLWAGVEGFSKFGSYEGNGNADGSFVYTGMKPSLVICKSTDSTSDWFMFDNQRLGYNVDNNSLFSNTTAAELTADNIDILSNGFKLRITTDPNVAETYVYMAWAESPFKYATAR